MTTDDTDSPPPDVPTRDAGRIAVKKTSPFGAVLPGGFRERLAMALKTRKADVLDAAAASYRGTFRSTSDYLARTLAEHMPEFLHWIFECIDYRKALRMYEGGQLAVWTIPLARGRVMVFESSRVQGAVEYTVPRGSTCVAVRGDAE